MGQIQSSVNNMLGTVGALATLSPGLRSKAEKRAAISENERDIKNLQKQAAVDAERLRSGASVSDQVELDLLKERADKYKSAVGKAFDLSPTAKNADRYAKISEVNKGVNDLISRQQQALDKMTATKSAKTTQRRNFLSYISSMETSLGGTVGELPLNMQKQIASQYDRNARRRMMNQMDREANNGK